MTISQMPQRGTSASALVAAEIRAELGRQGLNQSDLARLMGVNRVWTSSRLKAAGAQDLKIDEILQMAETLGVSPERFLSVLLPRLDSNQQPSGYTHPQVTGQVVDLFTRERVA